jgi:hypothetical protein
MTAGASTRACYSRCERTEGGHRRDPSREMDAEAPGSSRCRSQWARSGLSDEERDLADSDAIRQKS